MHYYQNLTLNLSLVAYCSPRILAFCQCFIRLSLQFDGLVITSFTRIVFFIFCLWAFSDPLPSFVSNFLIHHSLMRSSRRLIFQTRHQTHPQIITQLGGYVPSYVYDRGLIGYFRCL